ncbi:MAG TPA: alpha/beta hydrolase [Bryobacteraceae bacterium]|nr:alpha/beta hydrolase [Bryobacteraceae bacterium]
MELAARRPDLIDGMVLIDSFLIPPPLLLEGVRPLAEALQGPRYFEAMEQACSVLCHPIDNPERKAQVSVQMKKTQQHVSASAFRHHVTEYDATPIARQCRGPLAYIRAAIPMTRLEDFRKVCPQLLTPQTFGSGHFSPLEVPVQINAMLEGFLELDARQAI